MELAVGFAKAIETKNAVEEAKVQATEARDKIKLIERQNKPMNDLYE